MRESGDGACRELPLKADHHVHEDQQQGDDHRQRAAFGEFTTDLRADRLDALEFDPFDAGRNGVLQLAAQFVCVLVALRRQAYQQFARRPEYLHLCVRESRVGQIAAHTLDVGRPGITDLEQDAAREIDAELERTIVPDEGDERRDDDERRDADRKLAAQWAEEIEIRLLFDNAHRRHPIPALTSACGRRRSR